MQAHAEIDPEMQEIANMYWNRAKDSAIYWSGILSEGCGIHKQIANRITEPWMLMKTVISGTEWANFYWLRDHEDAQPEIRDLAYKMHIAHINSVPTILYPNEWHVPYVHTDRSLIDNSLCYYDHKGDELTAQEALIISASCCAQVSYRKNDDTLEKAEKIFQQLIYSKPAHASPVEHQATPMDLDSCLNYDPQTWEPGVTHVDAKGSLWSGNLRGWIQHRKLISDEAKW